MKKILLQPASFCGLVTFLKMYTIPEKLTTTGSVTQNTRLNVFGIITLTCNILS